MREDPSPLAVSPAGEPLESLSHSPTTDGVLSIVKTRRWIGYGLGSFGVVAMVALFLFALFHLHDLTQVPVSETIHLQALALHLGAHAVVTGAAVYFLYQLLRAAERMMLPWYWFEKNTEAAKALLGVTDPGKSAARLAEQLLRVLLKEK